MPLIKVDADSSFSFEPILLMIDTDRSVKILSIMLALLLLRLIDLPSVYGMSVLYRSGLALRTS
jgi:hypothetical protein